MKQIGFILLIFALSAGPSLKKSEAFPRRCFFSVLALTPEETERGIRHLWPALSRQDNQEKNFSNQKHRGPLEFIRSYYLAHLPELSTQSNHGAMNRDRLIQFALNPAQIDPNLDEELLEFPTHFHLFERFLVVFSLNGEWMELWTLEQNAKWRGFWYADQLDPFQKKNLSLKQEVFYDEIRQKIFIPLSQMDDSYLVVEENEAEVFQASTTKSLSKNATTRPHQVMDLGEFLRP